MRLHVYAVGIKCVHDTIIVWKKKKKKGIRPILLFFFFVRECPQHKDVFDILTPMDTIKFKTKV